ESVLLSARCRLPAFRLISPRITRDHCPAYRPPSTQSGRSSFLKAVIYARSLDHLVRLQKQLLRNGESYRLRGLEIDYELELRRLLDGQVPGLRALEDLVHVGGCPIELFPGDLSVTHQCAGLHGSPCPEHRGQALLRGELRDPARLP